MADLHRLPHRLGDALPGRVDQGARRGTRDEDPRQVEQQRGVLVAPRIQPGQRHQEFAAAQVGIADQVEGGIGRDEAVIAERAQQVRAAASDHPLDLGKARRRLAARRQADGLRLGMVELDRVQQRRHRLADRGPVRRLVVARPDQGRAQALQPRRVVQFGKPGPPQQRAQRRIAERGPVEFGEMRVAAGAVQQQGIADVIERRAVLPGRQRAVGGPGEVLKRHEISFRAIWPHVPPAAPIRVPRRPTLLPGPASPQKWHESAR